MTEFAGRRVVIAEDDPDTLAALGRLLVAERFEVLTATDGEAALELVRERDPDLVLCDVLMPERDGFDVCAAIKDDPDTRLVPVVLITGLGDREDRIRGIEAGADDFLTKPFERVELLARVRSLLRLKSYTDELERAETVLFALARSIEAKDPYTEGHCERLALYASDLGRYLGLPEDQILALRRAGTLHDIGKVAVPDTILLKPGPLSPEEQAVMREHTVVGERICASLRSLQLVLPIIRHHHERLDGTGYPDALAGEEIPYTARVLQVVDVYDALSTDRPYRKAQSPARALSILQDEADRGWWDPIVVTAFTNMVRDQPAA